MAQIIKHRRGSLESLSSVTGSLVKGEIVIATGSANLSNVTNGQGLVFAANADGQIKAVNRVLRGNNPNIFSGSIYNGLLDGVPFYASSSKTLYLLGSDSNEAIDLTGNISTFSASVDSRLDSIETSLGGGGSLGTRVANLETISASYLDFTQSYYTDSASFATAISASDAEYTSFSASAAATYAVSSSVASATADSITSLSSSVKAVTDTLAVSSSVASATADSITSLSSSVKAVTDTLAVSSSVASATADSITSLSSSIASQKYAQLSASNVFYGTQTITGSVYISADLIVQGSSSLQNITASAVDIGTNTILLNTNSPAVRFGGISVTDSGSTGGTGSLWWDSINNHWIYEHPADSEAPYNSAMLIAGPKNTGSLGEEVGLTTGYVPVAIGDDHIGDSIISASVTKVSVLGDLDVNGEISSSTIAGIGNVAAYSTSVDSRVASLESSVGAGGAIGTRVSNLETISASYLDFTQSYYSDSASFDTRISSSKAEYTSFSASAASTLSSLSASIYQTDATQSTNVTNISSSLAGRVNTLETAGYAVSSSVASATADSISTLSGSVKAVTDTLAVSSSVASATADSISTLSGSVKAVTDTLAVSSSVASATANSITALSSSVKAVTDTLAVSSSVASATANSLSTLSASIYQTDATQSTNFTELSSSVFTQFSASAANELALSTSVDSRLDSIESSLGAGGGIGTRVENLETISASYLEFTQSYYTTSGSIATQFSASAASVTALSASIDGRVDKLEASQSAFDTAFTLSGENVTVKGDLIVNGTTTTVNSTTIELGDNIISLRGTTSAYAGIQISDAVNPSTTSGSLLWDLTNDYWIAGKSGSESKVLVAVGDNVVSSSAQITLSSVTGYSTFSSSIATDFSASNANIASLSASVASVTGDFSSSVATSFSASAANVTALSTSVDSRLDTLEGTGTIQGVGTTNDVTFNSVTASVNLGSAAGSTKRIAFRNTNGNIDLVPTASVAGDMVQWDGTDFVMSNVIDGGSF